MNIPSHLCDGLKHLPMYEEDTGGIELSDNIESNVPLEIYNVAPKKRYVVDWDRIKTFEDYLKVMKVFDVRLFVYCDSSESITKDFLWMFNEGFLKEELQ